MLRAFPNVIDESASSTITKGDCLCAAHLTETATAIASTIIQGSDCETCKLCCHTFNLLQKGDFVSLLNTCTWHGSKCRHSNCHTAQHSRSACIGSCQRLRCNSYYLPRLRYSNCSTTCWEIHSILMVVGLTSVPQEKQACPAVHIEEHTPNINATGPQNSS